MEGDLTVTGHAVKSVDLYLTETWQKHDSNRRSQSTISNVPDLDGLVIQNLYTVNQLNLTAVKFSFLKTQTYLAQENLAFGKIIFLKCGLLKMLFSLPFLKK